MSDKYYMEKDIEDTMIKLAKKKSFDKITVTDIVKECGISRQTFYYHYEDMLQLADQVLSRKIEEAADQASKSESAEAALSIFVESLCEYKEIISYMRYSKNKEHLIVTMLSNIKKVFYRIPECLAEDEKITFDFYLFSQYEELYAHGILGYLFVNLIEKNGNPNKISEQLYWVLEKNFKLYLK